jgi:hypothetical protein
MTRNSIMKMVKVSLLFLFMAAVTNTAFSGQDDHEKKDEPDCDYISTVEYL